MRGYYRELIARFGYLPGLIFNLNEEYNENYKLPQALKYMQQLAELDPYDHPRGIHNVNTPTDAYIDAPQIDFTSIQTGSPGGRDPGALSHNQRAVDWIERCRKRGRRVLMVGFDEGRPEQDRRAWWSAYLGGGVWEAHVLPPYDRPMSGLGASLDGTRRNAGVHGIAAILGNDAGQQRRPTRPGVLSGQARRDLRTLPARGRRSRRESPPQATVSR